MNVLSCFALAACGLVFASAPSSSSQDGDAMRFGNFSVSLAVENIEASHAFYEKLDFKQVGGNMKQNWVVMQNGRTTIGLFEGMFDKNIMTFNPGWDHNKNTLKDFDDVRDLQAKLVERGIKPIKPTSAKGNDPASIVIADPDGNQILIDQHVPRPKKKTGKKADKK